MILGKPRDGDDAARMLRMLSGRTHAVITGVCVVEASCQSQPPVASKTKTASETTQVTMCEISDEEIRDYIATGEPMDKREDMRFQASPLAGSAH